MDQLLRTGSLDDLDVKVGDYRIRGYDLAYEILAGRDGVVLASGMVVTGMISKVVTEV